MGTVTGSVIYTPPDQQYQIHASASGVKLGEIDYIQARHLGISGTLTASISGRGSVTNPELSATITIPQVEMRGQSISKAIAMLNLSQRHLNFTANGVSDAGNLQAKGDVALTGAYNATATLQIRGLSVGTVLANYVARVRPGVEGKAERGEQKIYWEERTR